MDGVDHTPQKDAQAVTERINHYRYPKSLVACVLITWRFSKHTDGVILRW